MNILVSYLIVCYLTSFYLAKNGFLSGNTNQIAMKIFSYLAKKFTFFYLSGCLLFIKLLSSDNSSGCITDIQKNKNPKLTSKWSDSCSLQKSANSGQLQIISHGEPLSCLYLNNHTFKQWCIQRGSLVVYIMCSPAQDHHV